MTDNLKGFPKNLLNIDTGAISFILGMALIATSLFKLLTSRLPGVSAITLLIPGIVLILGGTWITLANRGRSNYGAASPSRNPELKSSLEVAMELAWQDHHHARNQTWEALRIEALLAVALIGLDATRLVNSSIPSIGSILLFLLSISGIMITLHHRELERRKFRHIMHCEEALGLRKYIDGVTLPAPVYIWDIFLFWRSNTILFIMRMHFAILIISLLFFLSNLQ